MKLLFYKSPVLLSLRLIFLGFMGLFINLSYAWDAEGHDIVAQIAYNQLNPITKKNINYLFNQSSFHKNFHRFRSFTYSASWPDYLKYNVRGTTGVSDDMIMFLKTITNNWHYINTPYIKSNITPQPIDKDNAIWATNYLVQSLPILLRQQRYDQATYLLIMLVHIVADLHQPLHNCELYDANFPYGDNGGNLYKIKGLHGIRNLHSLWDQSLGRFNRYYFNAKKKGLNPFTAVVNKFSKQFQVLCNNAIDLNPSHWSQESHQIAVSYVYKFAPSIQHKPNQQYIQHGQTITALRMCLAGKRLAAILNNMKALKKPLQ